MTGVLPRGEGAHTYTCGGGVFGLGVLCGVGCTGTDWLVYWYTYWYNLAVARKGYRVGDVQVTVWLSPVQRAQLRALQGDRSLQETVVSLIGAAFEAREVQRDGVGDAGGRFGVPAAADERRSGRPGGGDGGSAVGVGADVVGRPLTGAERLALIVAQGPAPLVGAVEPEIPFADDGWVDPAEDIA